MSVWGKVIGGAAGFALGGPLGALIGVAAGHAMDRMRGAAKVAPSEARPVAFTVAVIALAAKMAKADGVVTRDEVDVFKRIFRIPPGDVGKVGRLFDAARRDAGGFEPYAEQIAQMFRDSPRVLEELLDGLFEIAKADNVVHPAELDYLRRVAALFGFDEAAFERIRAGHLGRGEADAYEILGVDSDAGDDELKAAHRRLARQYHPDRLIGEGLPQEFVDLANQKLATINDAYDRVRRERDLG
ncbi:MAG: TerB family tellurite resistance protein [Alphaproteobacteria bacterium]